MSEEQRLTLSVLQADVGGFIGHVTTHPEILDTAKERLSYSKGKGLIVDFHVLRCGSDLDIILTHFNPPGSTRVRDLAWNVLSACSEAAAKLKLFRETDGHAHPPSASFTTPGVKPILPLKKNKEPEGPCLVEMDFIERQSEPVIVLMATKTLAGTWNLPIYKVFADPFNTAGLLSDADMFKGFSFTVRDLIENSEITLSTPAEMYSLLALASRSSRYVITSVKRLSDGESAAAVSISQIERSDKDRLSIVNPVAVFRCHSGFPAVGETLEPFALPYLVEGRMDEPHSGPLMPVPFYEATPSRNNGPPRMIGAGFHLAGGRLLGPHDMFDDPGFDDSRRLASGINDYLRKHGPFEPHRIAGKDRSLTPPGIFNKILERFVR